VRVGERVVAYLVLGSDLSGQVRLAPDVVAYLEEGSPYTFAVKDLEQVSRVGMARAVVEGQGDHPLAGTTVPEDRAVEPGTWREPFVRH
jgi:D-alanine-D-alanine ligase-like ATP-grasp enzyme